MNPWRYIARLMAVLIVMIIAGFVASTAQAHTGHMKDVRVAVEVDGSPQHFSPLAQSSESPDFFFAASQTDDRQGSACRAGCCVMGGSCCQGMTSPSASIHAPSLSHSALFPAETPSIGSITPEALPKPPRSFA